MCAARRAGEGMQQAKQKGQKGLDQSSTGARVPTATS
jgi:hypothetical protein